MAVGNSISKEGIEKIRATPMLFIMGQARSGTTLLQSVLNAHPGMVGPPESKFMMVLYPRFAGIKHWNEKDIYSFIKELYYFPFFSKRWNIDKAILTSYLLAAKEQLDYSLACKIIYYLRGKRKGKENVYYLSDKNPGYFLLVKKLFKLFPDLKFIHLVRDPRDSALSAFKAFGGKNSFYIATKWVAVNTAIEKMKKEMPGRSITILYEDMVRNPEAVFGSICNFLNVPFLPEMLKREMPEAITGNEEIMDALNKRQSKLYSPISPSSIGNWKKDMNPFDTAVIERIAGKYATEQYGYNMNSLMDKSIHISSSKIIKWKYIYYIWQMFTRLRYKSYRINKLYSRFKQKIVGKDLLPGQHF